MWTIHVHSSYTLLYINNLVLRPSLIFSPSREVFFNDETGDLFDTGEVFTWESLGRTLERIAENGPDEFYSGETGQNLISDLQDIGGLMTLEDFASYS